MAKASRVEIPKQANPLLESLKTTDFQRLSSQFKKLKAELVEKVITPNKVKGKVEILGYDFQIKAESERQTGRNLARSIINDAFDPEFEAPTQLALVNTKKSAAIQTIKITIPNMDNPDRNISLVSVEDKAGLVTAFTPKSNVFIQRDPLESGRTRITEDIVKKE